MRGLSRKNILGALSDTEETWSAHAQPKWRWNQGFSLQNKNKHKQACIFTAAAERKRAKTQAPRTSCPCCWAGVDPGCPCLWAPTQLSSRQWPWSMVSLAFSFHQSHQREARVPAVPQSSFLGKWRDGDNRRPCWKTILFGFSPEDGGGPEQGPDHSPPFHGKTWVTPLGCHGRETFGSLSSVCT